MSRPEKCNGPSGKDIFLTRAGAQAALQAVRMKGGRRGGRVYLCIWGQHYHYTKGDRKRRKR